MQYAAMSGTFACDFVCSSCGHEETAYIAAVGGGAFSGGDAYEQAHADAGKSAVYLAMCVTCPKCGFVDQRATARLRNKALMHALGWPLGVLLVTWMVMGFRMDYLVALAIIGGAMLVLVSVPIFLTLRKRWWAKADSYVRWRSKEPPEKENPPSPAA